MAIGRNRQTKPKWVLLPNPVYCCLYCRPIFWRFARYLLASGLVLAFATAEASCQESPPASTTAAPAPAEGEVEALVLQLSSSSFRKREAAMARILQIGPTALPILKKVDSQSDPELSQRLTNIVDRLQNDDFEARIAAFLAFDSKSSLPGWQYASDKFGDRPLMRELYVDISRKHRVFVSALEGDAQARFAGLQSLNSEVMAATLDLDNQPNIADALAILLLATDSELPRLDSSDSLLIRLLRRYEIAAAFTDPELKDVFRKLTGRWLGRVGMDRRLDALDLALRWDFPEGLDLAKQSLAAEAPQEIHEWSMKVLARFGSPTDGIYLEKFIEDTRPAGEGYILRDPAGRTLVVQLGDVAMAAVAVLNKRELRDMGFPVGQSIERLVFDVDTLGFPIGEEGDAARTRVRDEIKRLIDAARPQ
jgi:hypothetical protein